MGGTGLYLRAVTDDLTFPGRFPAVAAGLAVELDASGPPGSDGRLAGCATSTPAWRRSTRWPRRGSSRATSDAWSGPSR